MGSIVTVGQNPTRKLRVGLIGSGKMGLQRLKAIAATAGPTVIGVSDIHAAQVPELEYVAARHGYGVDPSAKRGVGLVVRGEPIDLYAAFASERHRRDVAARVIERANTTAASMS